jgi:cell division protein FtsN
MAILALITLIAGIAGAWLSNQPESEITVTRTDRLNKTPDLARIESRLTRMEKRLSHILDPYIRRLNNLGNKLGNTQEQLIEHIRNTGQQQATIATGFGERLEEVEQRLAATNGRMDALSTMLDTLAAGKPKSAPDSGQTFFRTAPASAGSTGTGEAAAIATQHQTTGFTPVPEPEATASWAADVPVPAKPETPEPAAQQPVTAAPAESLTAAAPEPTPETRPEPAAQQPVPAAPAESQTAAAPEPAPETRPEPAAPADAGTATGTAKGNWVINIASYRNERIARRKLAQMQQQGVDVELVTARVNGKTIYRARVFGFANRRAATSASTEIKSKLGLEEIWITKR